MKFRRAIAWSATALLGVALSPVMTRADTAATQPTTAPSVNLVLPAATISPEAQALLDQIKSAYGSLKSLQMTGTISGNFDVDGEKKIQQSDLQGVFQAGGKFHSEVKGDTVIGNTGDKQFFYLDEQNSYLMFSTPKDKENLDTLDEEIGDRLLQQNLSLALALAPNAADVLTGDATTVTRVADLPIDGVACPCLSIIGESMDMLVAIDPQTHLIRRVVTDDAKLARQRGAQAVKLATVTTDLTNVVDGPVTDQQFAWTPPAGAQESHVPHSTLAGKAAPDFSLAGLDGKTVSNADLKGSVYFLDFWATWCGPCMVSMPEREQIYQDFKPAGLKAFAINEAEEKDAVSKFVADRKLSIPVLLDSDGKVGSVYAPAGIPVAVVVGKDGIVIDAFIGTGHYNRIRNDIKKALKNN